MKRGRLNMNITNAEFQILWDDVAAGAGDLPVRQSVPHPTQQGRTSTQIPTNAREVPRGCGSPKCIYGTGQNSSLAPTPGSYQNVPNPPASNFNDSSYVRYSGPRSPSLDASGVHPHTPRDTFTANQIPPETIPPPPPVPTPVTTMHSGIVTSTPNRPMDTSGSRGVDSTGNSTPSNAAGRQDFTETTNNSSGSGRTSSSGDTEKEVRIVIRGNHETCIQKMQEILRGLGIVAGLENFDISMGPRSTDCTDTSTDMQSSQTSSRRCGNPGPPPGPPNGGGGAGCSGTPGGSGNYLI
ncbi:unnamed protein product [Allacma fusca]|uniref:Uncharacterized protein n=1 Tax=Allacma fusca TaxID=39272 RepID=A0A8J2L5U6_9HEXA|nr:unnamed protein product [Allacma fusca]